MLLLAAYGIGLGKVGFGGVGMIGMILVAEIFPARQSTGVVLPMLLIADVFAVWRFRKFAVWKHIVRILPPAFGGVVLGWWIMPIIPEEGFAKVIGSVILLMIVLLVLTRTLPKLRNITLEHQGLLFPTGLAAGVTTMLANAAGPITTLYLLACRLPKMEFVGTGAWFFLIVNLVKVPFSLNLGLISPGSLGVNLLVAPAIILGIFTGRWILERISQKLFEILLIGFATLGAIRLILT